MRGQVVCEAHGGMSSQALRRATCDRVEAAGRALVADAMVRHERRYRAWLVKRIALAAQLLDLPATDFIADGQPNWLLLGWAAAQPDWPANFPPEPQLADCYDQRRQKRLRRLFDELAATEQSHAAP